MTYTVRSGDSMWAIARRYSVSLDALIRANPQVKNPNLIYAGQGIKIPGWDGRDGFDPSPSAGTGGSYVVRYGDTMSAIAARSGVSLQALIAANPQVKNPNLIHVGQRLNIPSGGRVPQPPPDTGGAPVGGSTGTPGANSYYDAFVRAADKAGVPRSWASNPALLELVEHESGWSPGAKNPTSSAFGLFQFLDSTWQSYLPEVPYGTRDPYWQAVGGLRYIKQRYGTPERAWAFWRATVNKNPSLAPADLQNLVRYWISKGYAGY